MPAAVLGKVAWSSSSSSSSSPSATATTTTGAISSSSSDRKRDYILNRTRRFVDLRRVLFRGGHGGSGCVAWKKDRHKRHARRVGADGAPGGGVVLRADESLSSLGHVPVTVNGMAGGDGRGGRQTGAEGQDRIVYVPAGTAVYEATEAVPEIQEAEENKGEQELVDENRIMMSAMSVFEEEEREKGEGWGRWEKENAALTSNTAPPALITPPIPAANTTLRLVADLSHHGAEYRAVEGGAPGRGNAGGDLITRVDSPQSDSVRGLPGGERRLTLELKTLADVGLVGLPNAGKSSFLSAVSRADPRVAPYPFTTLNPYLGVLPFGDGFSLSFADIPGIVEGASVNRGLGHRFLRHIERTHVHVIVIDAAGPEPEQDLETVLREMEAYSAGLGSKRALVVANKADLLSTSSGGDIKDNLDPRTAKKEATAILSRLEQFGHVVKPISARTGQGVAEVALHLRAMIEPERKAARKTAGRSRFLERLANGGGGGICDQ